jgi:hypothetical protein
MHHDDQRPQRIPRCRYHDQGRFGYSEVTVKVADGIVMIAIVTRASSKHLGLK